LNLGRHPSVGGVPGGVAGLAANTFVAGTPARRGRPADGQTGKTGPGGDVPDPAALFRWADGETGGLGGILEATRLLAAGPQENHIRKSKIQPGAKGSLVLDFEDMKPGLNFYNGRTIQRDRPGFSREHPGDPNATGCIPYIKPIGGPPGTSSSVYEPNLRPHRGRFVKNAWCWRNKPGGAGRLRTAWKKQAPLLGRPSEESAQKGAKVGESCKIQARWFFGGNLPMRNEHLFSDAKKHQKHQLKTNENQKAFDSVFY